LFGEITFCPKKSGAEIAKTFLSLKIIDKARIKLLVLLVEAQKYFLPPGAGYPRSATALTLANKQRRKLKTILANLI